MVGDCVGSLDGKEESLWRFGIPPLDCAVRRCAVECRVYFNRIEVLRIVSEVFTLWKTFWVERARPAICHESRRAYADEIWVRHKEIINTPVSAVNRPPRQ